MKKAPFVGRTRELAQLNDLLDKKTSSLVVIKGRRRIGKSRLVREFASKKRYYAFSGLPPTESVTAQMQRDEFARQLATATHLPEISADDWSKLFALLAEKAKLEKTIILFDEISWMGSKDPDFLGKLKNCWDMNFADNPHVILILCGSVSSWIEKNIISSTGFFGRISLKITLEELPLANCHQLMNALGFQRSPLEELLLLAVTGGVPWYIEQINPVYSAADNIKRLCFVNNGLLVDEFRFIFHDLFGRRGEICQKIVAHLAKGPCQYADMVSALDYHSSGSLSEYLDDLLTSGFISRDYTWSLKTGKESPRFSMFRLSDNYLRFYLKYIFPRLRQIKKDQFTQLSLTSLPGWDSMMGLQFENLVLKNRQTMHKMLKINPEEIISDNPYIQHKNSKQRGCQIDYLIQTRYNTLFVCEITFSKNNITGSVISEVKEKISRLTLPRGFSCLPVLIHAGNISDEINEADYFFKTINVSDLLD